MTRSRTPAVLLRGETHSLLVPKVPNQSPPRRSDPHLHNAEGHPLEVITMTSIRGQFCLKRFSGLCRTLVLRRPLRTRHHSLK